MAEKISSIAWDRGVMVPLERILLTGFRATGKSLVGRLLADRIGWKFLDTDALLCGQTGRSVCAYVAAFGWKRFRQIEERLLVDLRMRRSVIIATGGGAIVHEQAWQTLRKKSIVIWLRADEQTIEHRLRIDTHSGNQRPSLTGGDPQQEISGLLAERTPLYRKGSDVAVITDGRLPIDLVTEIERKLADVGGGPA